MPKFFGFIMFGNRCFGKLYDCLALAYKVTVVLVSQLSLSFSVLPILGLSLSLSGDLFGPIKMRILQTLELH